MPIKGLSDRGLSFPEIGQIRKGKKEQRKRRDGSTYETPVDLPYFRVTFDEREQEAEQTFKEKYGEEPTEINVLLPFNDIDQCWDAWLEAYTAGRMVARSDGERFLYWVDTKTGEVKVKNGQPHTPYTEGQVVGTYESRGKIEQIYCKPVGRLKVILPELARAAYVTALTTSIHDIVNLSAQLEAFKRVNGGQIAGIPLVLRRRPKKISTPSANGQRSRLTKWMLSIEADPEWVKRLLTQTKRLALPGNGLALLGDGKQAEEPDEVIETTATAVEEDDWEPPADPDGGEIQDPEFTDEPEPELVGTGEAASEQVPVAGPYADLIEKAKSDPTTAYWTLCRRIGWSVPGDEASALLNEHQRDFMAAFEALLKQVPQ